MTCMITVSVRTKIRITLTLTVIVHISNYSFWSAPNKAHCLRLLTRNTLQPNMAITRLGCESRLAATTLPHFGSPRAQTYASDGKERQLQEPSTLLQHICNEIKQMCHHRQSGRIPCEANSRYLFRSILFFPPHRSDMFHRLGLNVAPNFTMIVRGEVGCGTQHCKFYEIWGYKRPQRRIPARFLLNFQGLWACSFMTY